jgi:hypothetical protein
MLAALLVIWLLGGGVGYSTAGYVDQVTSYAMTALMRHSAKPCWRRPGN